MQAITEWLGAHMTELLLGAITWLLGLAVAALRKLPRFLLSLAENFAAEAHKTPGQADDVAAQMALAAARALAGAVDATFDRAPSTEGQRALLKPLSSTPMIRKGPNP